MCFHRPISEDAYIRPVFSKNDKLKRFLWQITWNLLCRFTPRPFHGWRILILRSFGAKIGKRNFIYPNCSIWAPWMLVTGDVVTIGPGVEVYNPGGIRLEHHVIISQDAYLCGATHDYNSIDFNYIKKEIIVKPYAWICAKAIVLPGVCCGEGSVLGAGSVTSKDLAPWTVYAGHPAHAKKARRNFLEKNYKIYPNEFRTGIPAEL